MWRHCFLLQRPNAAGNFDRLQTDSNIIEMYMNTNPNQFGFKKKHGTDQCIYVLKELIDL